MASGRFFHSCALIFFVLVGMLLAGDLKAENAKPDLNKMDSTEMQKKIKHFVEVERQLLEEFVGLDHEIHLLMAAVRNIVFDPSRVPRPVVIPLIGWAGYGKTTLIQRALELMDYNHRFGQANISKNSAEMPVDALRKLAAPVAGDAGKPEPAFFLLDELENLMPYDQLTETVTKKDGNGQEYFVWGTKPIRQKSMEFWWQVLGNGIAKDTHKFSENGHHSNPDSPFKLISEIEEYLSNTNSNDRLVKTVDDFLKLYPIAFFGFDDLTSDTIVQMLNGNKEEVLKRVKENLRRFRWDAESYKHVIILVTANPTPIIQRVMTRFYGQQISPDSLSEAAKDIPTGAVFQWFRQIFGVDEAWESRWNVNEWELHKPFNSQQWKMAIDRLLGTTKTRIADRLKTLGLDAQIHIDPSVAVAFNQKLVDPIHGPRALYSGASLFLSEMSAVIVSQAIEAGASKSRFEVRFNTQTNRLHVYRQLVGQDAAITNTEIKLDFPKSPKEKTNPIKSSDLTEGLRLMALQQAAYAVAGMVMFQSVPTQLSRNVIPGDQTITTIWDLPAVKDHWYERVHSMMVMGGMLSQTNWNPTQFTAEMQLRDRQNLDIILRQIFEDINRRREVLSFLNTQGQAVDLDKVFPVALFNDRIYQAVAANNPAEAMRLLYIQVQNLLGQHERLIGAIQDQLVKDGSIDASAIKELVQKHMTARSHRELKSNILKNSAGSLNMEKHPMFFARYNPTVMQRLYGFMSRLFRRSDQFSPPTLFTPKSYVSCVDALTGGRKK